MWRLPSPERARPAVPITCVCQTVVDGIKELFYISNLFELGMSQRPQNAEKKDKNGLQIAPPVHSQQSPHSISHLIDNVHILTQHQFQTQSRSNVNLLFTLTPLLQIFVEPLKALLRRFPKPCPLGNHKRQDARKLLRLHKRRPPRCTLARLKPELMLAREEAWDAPEHASPAELLRRVGHDGRRDGHALEDITELSAGGDSGVGGCN
jgi:hypothetical protein